MKLLKIILKGSIGNYNFGDDLLTYSICNYLDNLNIPIEITVLSKENYVGKLIKNLRIVSHDNAIGFYDFMVYAGGTQFASFNKQNNLLGYFTKNRIFYYLKNPITFFKRIRKKMLGGNILKYNSLAILGIGIGPFYEKDKYFNSTIELLKRSNMIAVRDVLSGDICKENSLPFIAGSDLVYSLPESFWEKFQYNSNNIRAIAVIIRDWEFSKEDASFSYKLNDLEYKNCKINFFSFCENRDKQSIEFLKKSGYSDSLKIWNPNTMTFDVFLNELSKFDIFITSRYHGAIVASLLKKPFISIGLDPKLEMVAKLFDMPCWKYPYSINKCHSLIKTVDEDYKNISLRYNSQLRNERNKNSHMMNVFKDLLVDNLE